MKTTQVPTFWAKIYVATPDPLSQSGAISLCRDYVDDAGLCVTVTPTVYAYTNGTETGVIVGLINYPRFPSKPEKIRLLAIKLAQKLKKRFAQKRVTVMFPDNTVMLGEV